MKDGFARPFFNATSSEAWGSIVWQNGKYPAKIYTIDGVLIYQSENGDDNTNKSPLGGVIVQSSVASSMLATIANPIIYYGSYSAVINQAGHSGDLYDYYWTSYSRGIDGRTNDHPQNEPNQHNSYLDGYIPLRVKSIYDPCPYLYRIPSNGTYNQFTSNPGWTTWSYLGGVSWKITTLGESWVPGFGGLSGGSSVFEHTGEWGFYYSGTTNSRTNGYAFFFNSSKGIYPNRNNHPHSYAMSVRCIEGFNVTFVAPKVTKMPNAKSTSASL